MKKIIRFLLVFAMVAALAACGAKEEEPVETIKEEATIATVKEEETIETVAVVEEKVVAILEAKNCFYDAGFVELVAGAEESADYTFTAENSETVEWWVYVLEESFDEGFRYIKQVAEPVLVGDGEVSVDEGMYVYVYCTANEFTTDVADEQAALKITVK